MMLILAGFSSCQKDSFKPATTSNPTPDKVKTNSLDPQNYYADLVLQTRKPGENFDTYATIFNGVRVIVTGSPSWNTVMYPNLQNGVPTAGAGVSTDFGTNSFVSPIGTYGTSSKSIQDGDAFVIVQGQLGYFNASAFQADIDNFNFAFDVFVSTGASIPFIGNYIQDNYSTGGGVVATPAKLIRVTTGSHWAVATIDYPAPQISSSPVPVQLYIGSIYDPNDPTIYYNLFGNNGIIATQGEPGVGSKPASGTYTKTTISQGTNDVTVTITRANGSKFTITTRTTDFS